MNPVPLFAIQFFWFLLVWIVIANFFVAPRMRGRDVHDVLTVWVAPHLFRVLGVGLLVPNLSPGLPTHFALSTAIGDSVTAILALGSLVALRKRWSKAILLVWGFNVFGSCDLAIAFVQSIQVQAAQYLHAQWFVPAVGVPLMMVTHGMVFVTLVRQLPKRV